MVTSDIEFVAQGKTKEELFANCARLTMAVMGDVAKVEPKVGFPLELTKDSLVDLLFSFLDELIFLKDKHGMLFSQFDIIIDGNNLRATVFGEKIDPKKHELKVDVKAVTKHNFSAIKEDDMYKATVVLDV